MKCLVVLAHPLENSLCKHISDNAIAHLKSLGHSVTVKDLYQERFNPVLTKNERTSYYDEFYDNDIAADIRQLQQTESLILIFPTWWFNFPAVLKGWFDRVWAPGFAYHHATDFGPIKYGLGNLKRRFFAHKVCNLGA